jgi:hypothetical protein
VADTCSSALSECHKAVGLIFMWRLFRGGGVVVVVWREQVQVGNSGVEYPKHHGPESLGWHAAQDIPVRAPPPQPTNHLNV